ncbi:MAG: hypothetical protein AAGU32_11110 [Bacillota bacterium]
MEYKGSSFAFIAGLTTGIINILFGFNALLGILILSAFIAMPGAAAACVALFALTAVNLVGACVCRNHRIAGGVMMLATAFPLLIFGALYMLLSFIPSDVLQALSGLGLGGLSTRAIAAMGFLLLLIEGVSAAAGIVSLASRPKPEPEGPPVDREPQEHDISEQPFAQRYAAYMKREDDAPSA